MSHKHIWRSTTFLGLFALAAAVHAAGHQAAFINKLDNSLRERAALTRFRGHVAMAQMGNVTLAQAFAAVTDGTGLRIQIDWPALKAAHMSPDSPVTVGAKIMSFGDYLNAVSADLGVSLVIYFREPQGEFCLTTAAAAPLSAPAENEENYAAGANDILGGKKNIAAAIQLETRIAHFNFDQAGLAKVMDALQKTGNFNMDINWTALEAAGISKDTPVTIKLIGVTARDVLAEILQHAAGGAASLGYTIAGGVIEISTKDDLNSAKYQVVQVFDIHPLLAGRNPGASQYDDTVKNIVDLIKTTVAPDSWRDAGGTIGSIRELNGQLIINQTRDNELAVYHLLRQLEPRSPAKN